MFSLSDNQARILFLFALLAWMSGCKEQATVPPAVPVVTAKVPGEQQKTKLRVAVRPFTNSSRDEIQEAILPWTGIGLFYSPSAVISFRWKEPPSKSYIFDTGRMLASYLAEDLSASGEFETVGFEPQNLSAYDLIIDGEITNAGAKNKFPLIPLPFWIGSLVALGLSETAMSLEVSLHASAPLSSMTTPVLRYGMSAGCHESEKRCVGSSSFTQTYAFAIKRENERFVKVLSAYAASRTDAFWQSARDAANTRYYDSLDPELPALRKEIENSAEPLRAEAARALYGEKTALLDLLRAQETTVEQRWAATSYNRIRDERINGNKVAVKAYEDNLKTIAVASAKSGLRVASAVKSGEAPDSTALRDDLQQIRDKAQANAKKHFEENRAMVMSSNAKASAAFELASQSKSPRETWLLYYRSALPSVAQFRATPIAVPEPATPPTPTPTATKNTSRRKNR